MHTCDKKFESDGYCGIMIQIVDNFQAKLESINVRINIGVENL